MKEPKPNVILLACPHTPHTSMVRVKCKPPQVIFSGCEECAKKFFEACVGLGAEVIKPKNLL
ncbi:hypothetical protein A3J33_00645 [candidate division WWE3 bacterium RIFCSPLOWO2_02_FULL_53_10]|uniref:Uncharacterized protein n=2 Tax=Katanobacteria TaxID=422282 RepID=A0A1F4WNL3_UNCKA|nr:MAG: hypothetical protein A2890_00105 [candidate division WWE3 bacterium RIFCSPLOWO2_01_FULL_53_14]OGC70951.1 MAG: hypothetical protein A3J33_00645 [candidate division WWE3 bacterium RIFCSPLOWO2_02_FULL_53_10]